MSHNFINRLLLLIAVFGFISCSHKESRQADTSAPSKTDAIVDQLDELNKSIREDSLNPDLYRDRAEFYLDNEEYNEAFKDITSAIEIDSTYSGYYVTLSDVYLSMGKLQKSVEALEKSIQLNKENPDAYLRLAEINIVILDYNEALTYIDKALKVDELAPKGYLLRGVVMLENGDTIRAIRNFQKAIDVDQNYFDAHMQLAQLYAMKGNDLAVDYFNNALNIQPDNDEVMYSLAMYYQETGQYDKAIQQYNILLDRNPDFYFATFNIGYIYLVYLQDYQKAVDYFTQTIDMRKDYAEAYYNRGFAYELLKDVDKSWADYKKTLELHANYDKAIEGLNRIEEFRRKASN